MVFKALFAMGGAIAGMSMISEAFGRKIDQSFARPFRNYRASLEDWNSFKMPEDLALFKTELKQGFSDIFKKDFE